VNSAYPPGETRAKKREDCQGGGVHASLSGGDERSEPESQIDKIPFVSKAHAHTECEAVTPARSAGVAASLPCLSSSLSELKIAFL
jgi:hypothetical protein